MKIIVVSLLLLVILIPFAHAEPFLKTMNDKYTITKNVGWAPWWDDSMQPIEITLVDSRNSTQQAKISESTFDILIPNFMATSKGKVSAASNILPSDSIIVFPIDKNPQSILNGTLVNNEIKEITLSGNLTKFRIILDVDKTDTVTYSGKIYLKNESVLIPISLDIVIQHDNLELIMTTLSGIFVGIFASWVVIKMDWTRFKSKRKFKFTDNKPWISTGIITVIGVPAVVLTNTTFIGNSFIDVLIAFIAGLLVIPKLLAPDNSTKPKTNKLSMEYVDKSSIPNQTGKISMEYVEENLNLEQKTKLQIIYSEVEKFVKLKSSHR